LGGGGWTGNEKRKYNQSEQSDHETDPFCPR
jgi:hypothetical protein